MTETDLHGAFKTLEAKKTDTDLCGAEEKGKLSKKVSESDHGTVDGEVRTRAFRRRPAPEAGALDRSATSTFTTQMLTNFFLGI